MVEIDNIFSDDLNFYNKFKFEVPSGLTVEIMTNTEFYDKLVNNDIFENPLTGESDRLVFFILTNRWQFLKLTIEDRLFILKRHRDLLV